MAYTALARSDSDYGESRATPRGRHGGRGRAFLTQCACRGYAFCLYVRPAAVAVPPVLTAVVCMCCFRLSFEGSMYAHSSHSDARSRT